MKTDTMLIGAVLAFGAYLYVTHKKAASAALDSTNATPMMAPRNSRSAQVNYVSPLSPQTVNGFDYR